MLTLLMALQIAPLDPGGPAPLHDALHYRIGVVLPDTGRTLEGRVTTTWLLRGTDPLHIDLDSTMEVTRATIGETRDIIWDRDANAVIIHHGGERGDTVYTTIYYRGEVLDGLIIEHPGGASRYFADNWPNRARRWFPAQDHPSDKATVTFVVDAAASLDVIANGSLESVDTLETGRVRWTYRESADIPVYTMVVGASEFSITNLPDAGCAQKCVPLSVWTYPADSAWAMRGPFRRVGSMVDYFSDLIGPFPYGSLAHVESSTIFGGMENATAIFYSSEALGERRLSEETVAHETAHQWFGDAVTPRDWNHLWLSEGFSVYLAALWLGHANGPNAFYQAMDLARARVVSSLTSIAPILADTLPDNLLTLLNSNNYQKGAWTLHSLRAVVGDSAFFAGLRAYYAQYRNGTVVTADFIGVMEEVSGQDLGWYFDQALHQPRYPRVFVDWSHDAASGELTLRITQQQRGDAFRLPGLELAIDDRIITVDVDGSETEVVLADFPQAPRRIVIDPRVLWLMERHVQE